MLEHEGGIPKIVFYQALNFFALIGLLYYLTKNKVTGFFNKRHETLKAAVNESRRLKEEAEKRHQDYTLKFQKLDQDTEENIEKIKREGAETKKRIIEEAHKTAAIIEAETKKAIELELNRAKKQLFEEALEKSLTGAKELLEKNVEASDQQRLQKEFMTEVESMK